MSKLIVMSGLPGAGKTVYARKFAKENNYRYIGIDEFYKAVYGNETTREHKQLIWEMCLKAVEIAAFDGVDVILDTNSPNPRDRNILYERVGKLFLEREIIYLQNSEENCIENNKFRSRVIPDEDMFKLFNSYEPPTLFEVFGKWKLHKVKSPINFT